MVSAADADRANQLILDDDRQAAADEVVRKALLFAEVQPDQPPIHSAEALRDGARRRARVQRGLCLHQSRLGANRQHAVHHMRVDDVAVRREHVNRVGARTTLLIASELEARVDDRSGGLRVDLHLHQRPLRDVVRHRDLGERRRSGALCPPLAATKHETPPRMPDSLHHGVLL